MKKTPMFHLFPEIRAITESFTDAQFGSLIRAGIDYQFAGKVYQGNDPLVGLAFRMLANQTDRYLEATAAYSAAAKKRWEQPVQEATPVEEAAPTAPVSDDFQADTQEAMQADECEDMPADANVCEDMQTDANVCDEMPLHANECEAMQPYAPIHSVPIHSNPVQSFPVHSNPRESNATRTRFVPPEFSKLLSFCQENQLHVDPRAFWDYYCAKGWMMGSVPMQDWQAALRNWARREKSPPTDRRKLDSDERKAIQRMMQEDTT